MHSYANDRHERRVREIVAEEYPELRGVALLRGAAGISRVRARGDDAGRRVRQAAHGALSASASTTSSVPGLRDEAVPGDAVERRRRQRPSRWCSKPITTALSGPAAGALGSAVIAEIAGFSERGDAGRRRHLDRPLPDRERQAACHQRRRGRPVPGAHPDDRHRDHRHRRRLDRLDQPRGPSQGRAEAAPAPSPARCATRTAASEPTITDANLVLGRIPPALIGGGIALDVDARARRHRRAGGAASRQHERRAARRRHHRDRQLEPGQRHPPDDDPARHRSARLRAALVRRRRARRSRPR